MKIGKEGKLYFSLREDKYYLTIELPNISKVYSFEDIEDIKLIVGMEGYFDLSCLNRSESGKISRDIYNLYSSNCEELLKYYNIIQSDYVI